MTNSNTIIALLLSIVAGCSATAAVYMLISAGNPPLVQAFGVGSAVFCFLIAILHFVLSASPLR